MEEFAMKKIFVIVLLAGYCLTGIASKPAAWVNSKTGKIDIKKIALSGTKARIVLNDGKKMILPIDQVLAYSVDGKIFEHMPLYKNGKATGKTAFMELIKTRSGLGIYQYSYWDMSSDPVYKAFVYKGDQMELELDQKTLPNVCKFFAVKGVIK
jgi:hypothetical protein